MADDTKRKAIVCATMLLAKAHEELLGDFDKEERPGRRRKVPRVEDYCEVTVQRMSDGDFQRSFRLTRATFNDLSLQLGPKIDTREAVGLCAGRHSLSADKQLMIALQMMANQDPYRSIANLFNISTSTAWQVTMRVCRALIELNQEAGIISWPGGQKALDVIGDFERAYGFPGVIGAIDGSHIPIKAPKLNHVSYVNRKGFHSILLQAVCDRNLMFTDCYAGEVGSVHDSCMLRRSDLASQMATNTTMFPGDSHMIGDPAYPLSINLMVPYKDNGRLDARQRKYNETLSAARSVIERAFALLKGRFRRLKYVDMTNTENIPVVIMSCCILHNFCLSRGDVLDGIEDLLNDDNDSTPTRELPTTCASSRRREAVAKRDRIAQSL